MVKKMSLKTYKKIYSKVPRLTVDILIKHSGGIVLAKRDVGPCKGMWHIPGGTILMGENIESAIKRIAKEEVGLNVRIKKRIDVKEYSRKSAFGQVIALIYLTETTGGKLRGYKYGKEVRVFKKIPKNIIKEQISILPLKR